MNTTKTYIWLFSLVTFLMVGVTSCSENSDDPKYRSKLPVFADITATALDGGEIKAGTDVVMTAVQSKAGRLLDNTTYTWSCSPFNSDVNHRYKKKVIYDVQNANPVDTLSFPHSGKYEVTFVGKYSISGQYDMYNSTEKLENGTTVTYKTLGQLHYEVTLKKWITVK